MFSDVVLDCFLLDITNASEYFSDAPEMSFRITLPEIWELSEQQISTSALKFMECVRNAHRRWDVNFRMHVVIIYNYFLHSNFVSLSNFPYEEFAQAFYVLAPKRFIAVLGTPYEMVRTLSKAVAKRIHIESSVTMHYMRYGDIAQHGYIYSCSKSQKKLTDSSMA
jgi:hypothetical protein